MRKGTASVVLCPLCPRDIHSLTLHSAFQLIDESAGNASDEVPPLGQIGNLRNLPILHDPALAPQSDQS